MRVVVTGATGTIGRALVAELLDHGDEVVALARDAERATAVLPPGTAVAEWRQPDAEPAPAQALAGADAVVHLAGATVAQRWTAKAKEAIRSSRVEGTRNLVAGMAAALPHPRVLVSQSASGYYGARGDEPLDESAPPGEGFLASVVTGWEAEARKAADLGVRVVCTRTGVVLSPRGGALAKMLPPFRLGIGGPVAGGRQYVPWVHLDDAVGAIRFCIGDERAEGPVNVAAPEPVTNRELSRALGRVLRRPAVVPVPALALRALYGEMATIVTTGVRMTPRRLSELGYRFRHPDLEPALRAATSG